MNPPVISVIVTTYRWPMALAACLQSLREQRVLPLEVIVTEDDCDPATADVISIVKRGFPVPLRHLTQEDRGFRAATARNRAALLAQGNYLLFIDGDCLMRPGFVAAHAQLAQAKRWVAGNRILLSRHFSERVLAKELPVHRYPFWQLLRHRLQGDLNRLLPLLRLPGSDWRNRHPEHWEKAQTCNLGVWRADFERVNGFDEAYQGWGYEDSDLVIRLIHAGVFRREGRFAVPVLHLWHRENPRDQAQSNYQRLLARLQQPDLIRAERGLAEQAGQP